MADPSTSTRDSHTAGAFDVRTFIALLLGIYGVVLTAMGLFATSEDDLAKADGMNVNLWTGVALVVVAALFQLWAMLRPTVVPDDFEADDDGPGAVQ